MGHMRFIAHRMGNTCRSDDVEASVSDARVVHERARELVERIVPHTCSSGLSKGEAANKKTSPEALGLVQVRRLLHVQASAIARVCHALAEVDAAVLPKEFHQSHACETQPDGVASERL